MGSKGEKKKLVLRRQTVRELQMEDLAKVAGGQANSNLSNGCGGDGGDSASAAPPPWPPIQPTSGKPTANCHQATTG